MHSNEDFRLSICAITERCFSVSTEDEQVCVLCTSYEILSILRLAKPSTIVERDIWWYLVGNMNLFAHS